MVTEGYVVFKHPSLPADVECKTWYRIVGDLAGGKRPLLTLHGGPGMSHLYLTVPFDDYAAQTGQPVVYYDQLGCGNSTRLRSKRLDETFWTPALLIAELDNLLRHLGIRDDFDVYGQSWGAMFAPLYLVSDVGKDSGLKRMILGSGPCRAADWDSAGNDIVAAQPAEDQAILRKYAAEGQYDHPEFKRVLLGVYQQHTCRMDPWPQIVVDSFQLLEDDDTVYMTMCGPNELEITGSLRTYDMSEKCKGITVPTLVIYGEFDQCTTACVKPWMEGIKGAQLARVDGGSHLAHVEQPEKYIKLVRDFLGH